MLILIYNTINKWRGTIFESNNHTKTNKNISRLFLYFDDDHLCLVYWNADFGT